jgi:cation diffusion facilitator CzcD-associated flavoprotein CzcO
VDSDYFDVIIVGAGLSGIGAAWHLQEKCPGKSYAILEGRASLGGTWDIFRYPGIRSDSDMFTLGYNFKPWQDGKAIADGPSILNYINETSTEGGIDDHIRYNHMVVGADWSSEDCLWTVRAENKSSGETVSIRCNFLLMCSGYYSYKQGYSPDFPGRERFAGEIVHPQFWPEDMHYSDKRVVVIGSGATAVTLIPEMADDTAHITMLQRSPTYMVSMPDVDVVANFLRKILPAKLAYAITRWKNIRFQRFIYRQTRKAPEKVRNKLLRLAKKELGSDCDFDINFIPSYNPWDQRLCLVPNADFFHAVRDGKASVVTGEIETFTEKGIRLKSGDEIDADIIITATGLELCVLGDASFTVDGKNVDFSQSWSYKSMMFSDVPNLISTFGYINASWTLKADLTAEYACRVLNHMDATGTQQCVPTLRDNEKDMPAADWIQNFSSGYIQRKMHLLPKQGDRAPWLNSQNYMLDKKLIGDGPVDDGVLCFGNAAGNEAEVSRSDAA